MTDIKFGLVKVEKILDLKTVVLTGLGLNKFNINSKVYVLSIDKELAGIGIPLIMPKETLEITSLTNHYLIAKTVEKEVEELSGLAVFSSINSSRKVARRESFRADENDISGNPANQPIKIGDYVVRVEDLSAFVDIVKGMGITKINELVNGKS